jgi:hypothetical protein
VSRGAPRWSRAAARGRTGGVLVTRGRAA